MNKLAIGTKSSNSNQGDQPISRHLGMSKHGNLIINMGITTMKGNQSGMPKALTIGKSNAEMTVKMTHQSRKRIRY